MDQSGSRFYHGVEHRTAGCRDELVDEEGSNLDDKLVIGLLFLHGRLSQLVAEQQGVVAMGTYGLATIYMHVACTGHITAAKEFSFNKPLPCKL